MLRDEGLTTTFEINNIYRSTSSHTIILSLNIEAIRTDFAKKTLIIHYQTISKTTEISWFLFLERLLWSLFNSDIEEITSIGMSISFNGTKQ